MKRFALIGAAGYIAPRHMKAIRDTGNDLVAAMDVNDSVGILDSHFPDAQFFTEFEQFDRHVDSRKRAPGGAIDFMSIASPNYLHDAHMRFALRSGADAICEKPLVLYPERHRWPERDRGGDRKADQHDLAVAAASGHHRPARPGAAGPKDRKHDVDLTYITSRGNWYLKSWKGFNEKSGGIATNIGVHFYDMLHFMFGELQEQIWSI